MKVIKKPFIPLDTRRRIIKALEGGFTYQQAADAFGVGVATVNRIWRRFRETGKYDIGPRGGGTPRALDEKDEEKLRKLVESYPDATYDELTALWARNGNKRVSRSVIIRGIKKLGFSLKKKVRQAAQKLTPENKDRRAKFIRTLRRTSPKKLVFLDEAGFAASLRREKARSLIGELAVEYGFFGYSKNVTVCGAIRSSGPVVMQGQAKAMTKKSFLSFLRFKLFPRLRPGDVLVLDNLAAHKNTLVRKLARQWSIRLLYTPPYSPEFNAIEYIWGWMKQYLRKRLNRAARDFRYALSGAWRKVKQLNLPAIIENCLLQPQSPHKI